MHMGLVVQVVEKQDWKELSQLIIKSINKLKAAGKNFAIMPSNTPYFCFDYLNGKTSIPVFDLIQLSVDYCKKLQLRKVAVLGTKFTMEGDLYTVKLKAVGIEKVDIPAELVMAIDDLIMKELIPSRVIHADVERVRQEILKLNCDGVILGCTELADVFSEQNIPTKKVIDTTRLLAQKAVDYAMGYVTI